MVLGGMGRDGVAMYRGGNPLGCGWGSEAVLWRGFTSPTRKLEILQLGRGETLPRFSCCEPHFRHDNALCIGEEGSFFFKNRRFQKMRKRTTSFHPHHWVLNPLHAPFVSPKAHPSSLRLFPSPSSPAAHPHTANPAAHPPCLPAPSPSAWGPPHA